jgi:hypothetical protein
MPSLSSTYITHNDEIKTLKDWADYFNIDYQVVYDRYKRGLRGAELFRKPRAYNKRKAGLPPHMTRTEALLLGLDDYDRDHVQYYSQELNISPAEFISKALNHAFKKLDKHISA